MKKFKLNSKGFTLIELLAVIVILAILVVVTVPTVLGSINSAKTSAFTTSVDTIADWIEKQYGLYSLGDSSVNTAFTDWWAPGGVAKTVGTTYGLSGTATETALITGAGGSLSNYVISGTACSTSSNATCQFSVAINTTNRVCVVAYSNSSGKFGSQTTAGTNGDGVVKSSGC